MPSDRYRRRMKTHFNTKAYRRRPQVETVISMLKRNLGSALRGRSHHSRRRDMFLRVLTHNITLALLRVFYRALMTPFLPPRPLLRPRTDFTADIRHLIGMRTPRPNLFIARHNQLSSCTHLRDE